MGFETNRLLSVITGDESCCFGDDRETKWDSCFWKYQMSSGYGKLHQLKSNAMKMLICFVDEKANVHTEFSPVGQSLS